MIFVTVGSQLPFPRLVLAVEAWATAAGRSDVLFQVGETDEAPEGFRSVRGLDPGEFEVEIARASVIVGHAGTGTLMAALSASKPVVMLARREGLGETRNDHQVTTVERFGGRSGVHATTEADEVGGLIEAALSAGAPGEDSAVGQHASGPLVDRLRSFLQESMGPEARRSGGRAARGS